MHEPLESTFKFLARTDNDAAIGVLLAALNDPSEEVQYEALSTLLRRPGTAGGREILAMFDRLSQRQKDVILDHPGRMTRALRDALRGDDDAVFNTACRAVVTFHEYDLAPVLLGVMEDQQPPRSELAVQTLVKLVSVLYDELAASSGTAPKRDPQAMRRNLVAALEAGVQNFAKHKSIEVLECFLWLANRDNVLLKSILQNPHHAAFLLVMEILTKSQHGGIIRLLLGFLDDPRAPTAALGVAGSRGDAKFVRHLLKKIGREPSGQMAQNLKKIESIGWLRFKGTLLEQFDDAAQHAMVRMVMASGLPRPVAFEAITYILAHGKAGGRREAARALADFSGADANAICLRALDDADPQVQANILGHIRQRGIPGIFPHLVDMVESKHAVVRQAARQCLSEFTFERFVGAFDMLDEEVRRSTGLLVKRTDPQSLGELKKELESAVRTKRLRGVQMAVCMDLAEPLQETILALLKDEDHLVRVAAVKALAQCWTPAVRQALTEALHDRNAVVQEEARRVLAERREIDQYRELLAERQD